MDVKYSGNGNLYSGGGIPALCVPVPVNVCEVRTVPSWPPPWQWHERLSVCVSLQALPGPHYYTWGDHGGIIMAIAQGMETNELK